MKKKYPAIVMMTLFLGTAGAFYYEGSPAKVNATEEKSDLKAQISKIEETFKEEVKVPTVEPDLTSNENVENAEPIGKSDSSQQPAGSKPEKPESKPASVQDTFKIEDTTYYLISPQEKFNHDQEFAKKYGAKFYGVPNSDMFVFVRNGEAILQTSSGLAAAPLKYANILSDFLAPGGEYKNIAENVLFSAKTGAKITVEFGTQIGYSIWIENGVVVASW